MVTSAERGRDTRRRLLDAAAALIAEVGWGGVSTRLLAQRAGTNVGLVHYHFRSLSALLVEAAVDAARRAMLAPVLLLEQAPDIGRGIDDLLAAMRAYTGQDPTSRLLSEALLASAREERLRTAFKALLDEFRSEVAAWLVEQGHPDPAQADAAAAVLAMVLDGLVLHRSVDPDLDPAALAGPLRRLLADPNQP
jgi:AcrR family transcriptional regulator